MKQLATQLNRAACIALVAFTLQTLAATPTITGVTAQQRYPWNGKFDISYTASGVDDVCQVQGNVASLKAFAVEQTTHVTNEAEAAFLSGDTTMADGTHTFVWDMDAQDIFQGLVSTNFEVFVSVEMQAQEKPLGGVQLWENGPYWAECNVGATKPEEYGYYFWWGDTVGYTNTGSAWVSVKDGTSISFTLRTAPLFLPTPASVTYGKDNATLLNEGYIDSTGNLVAAHDAATAHLGGSWRMPTDDEVQALFYNCETSWITTNGVSGRRFTGRDKYASKSIFLPAAGYGSASSLFELNSQGDYWSSTPDPDDSNLAWEIYLHRNFIYWFSYSSRCSGQTVRPLRPKKVLYSNRSGAIRADLRTGAVRVAAATEALTYSTAWDSGETVTIQANGETLCQKTDSGIYNWAPTVGGTYALTHTAATSGEHAVLTAQFAVPYQMGDTTWAVVTNGVCSIYGTGVMKGCEAGNTSPLYASRNSITNLVVEEGITGIGARLFENFWYLQSVSLAASVTNVGARAFKKCYGLTDVTSRAKGTATVDDYAFAGCHSLKSLAFAGTPTFGTEAYAFQTAIYMKDGGIPEVYTMPTITVSGKSEHILGKKALADADWTDVTTFSDDAKREYHFFKIEMR